MALVNCPNCASPYNLKDEFLGRLLKCTTCGTEFEGVASAQVAAQPQALPIFERDRFFMRQKVMTLNQKYMISDEQGRPLIYVIRRYHSLKSVLALLAALATIALVTAAIGGGVHAAVGGGRDHERTLVIGYGLGFVVGVIAGVAVGVLIQPKRHVEFYADEAHTQRLFDILQDSKWQLINATYTVQDPGGQTLALFHKNYLHNFIRRKWNVWTPDRSALICRAFEDSILLSVLRRFLGTFYGLLRTNFIITSGGGQEVIGEFNRKFTLVDKYVLDLNNDPTRQLDRRLAVALAVMLDTGEKR